MGRAQKLRAPTPLRKDAHHRTNATYRSRQYAVNPTSSNNTGVFYLTVVRCTIHTPTVQCITLRCVQSTELQQHHKEYSYVLARQRQNESSAIQIIESDVLPQLSRYTRPLSRTRSTQGFGSPQTQYHSVEHYLQLMENPTTYATHTEIVAANQSINVEHPRATGIGWSTLSVTTKCKHI